ATLIAPLRISSAVPASISARPGPIATAKSQRSSIKSWKASPHHNDSLPAGLRHPAQETGQNATPRWARQRSAAHAPRLQSPHDTAFLPQTLAPAFDPPAPTAGTLSGAGHGRHARRYAGWAAPGSVPVAG